MTFESSSDHAATAPKANDSIADKLVREAGLFADGVSSGIGGSVDYALHHPTDAALTFATSAAMGAGLAYLQSHGGGVRMAAEVGALALSVPFFKNAVMRGNSIFSAMSDAWSNPNNYNADKSTIANAAGPFVVDFATAALGGSLGAGLGMATRESTIGATSLLRDRLINNSSLTSDVSFAGAPSRAFSQTIGESTLDRAAIASGDRAFSGRTGANGENLYLTGYHDANGVWQPIRDIHDLPVAGKRQLAGLLRNGASPLLDRANINDFVGSVGDVVSHFEPLPANASDADVIGRAKTLLDSINRFGSSHGVPRLRLSLADADTDESLVSGKMSFDHEDGAVIVNRGDLLANPALGSPDPAVTVGRLYHEVNHGVQDSDLFAYEAKNIGLSSTEKPNDFQRAELRENFQMHLGPRTHLSDSYIDRLWENWRNNPQTDNPARALQVMSGFVRGDDIGPEYARAADQISATSSLLGKLDGENGPAIVLNHLSTPSGERAIFGKAGAPQPVADLLAQGSQSPALMDGTARQTLSRALNENIDSLNAMRQQRYGKYMQFHEVESWIAQQKALAAARAAFPTSTAVH